MWLEIGTALLGAVLNEAQSDLDNQRALEQKQIDAQNAWALQQMQEKENQRVRQHETTMAIVNGVFSFLNAVANDTGNTNNSDN